jgi:hypothetical protein
MHSENKLSNEKMHFVLSGIDCMYSPCLVIETISRDFLSTTSIARAQSSTFHTSWYNVSLWRT